jgi:hypothetical protein
MPADDSAPAHEFGGWWFIARPRILAPGSMAWCAKTPALGANPLDVDIGQDVHFEFGETADEALRKLKAEVLN